MRDVDTIVDQYHKDRGYAAQQGKPLNKELKNLMHFHYHVGYLVGMVIGVAAGIAIGSLLWR